MYERIAGEGDHENSQLDGPHIMHRGTSREAANLVRNLIANHDDQAHTAHDVAAVTNPEHLPDRVASLLIDRRAKAREHRRGAYLNWQEEMHVRAEGHEQWREHQISRQLLLDPGIEL